jgi:hypothetical protein
VHESLHARRWYLQDFTHHTSALKSKDKYKVVRLHVQAALSRGLQHASPLVRHATLCTLRAMLSALGSALSAAAAAAACARSGLAAAEAAPAAAAKLHAPQQPPADGAAIGELAAAWDAFLIRLRSAARLRLPDLQALLALHASLEAQIRRPPAAAGIPASTDAKVRLAQCIFSCQHASKFAFFQAS